MALVAVAIVILLGALALHYKKAVPGQRYKNSASLVSQENNNFTIKLNFRDDEKGMQYSVSLFGANSDGEIIDRAPIDVAYYEDRTEQVGEERKIAYIAPNYLTGKYVVVVDFYNSAGNSEEPAIVGSFDLKGSKSGDFLGIDSKTCFLSVEGESGDKKYTVMQGVDVKSEEKLIATCKVTNHFAREMTVMPKFVNYYFGKKYNSVVSTQEEGSFDAITFGAGETKDVSLTIPKAVSPQVYDAVMFFVDEYGGKVSTRMSFHYIVAGENASIANVTTDKGMYAPNDKVKITAAYFGSVDGFANSRLGGTRNGKLTMSVDLKNPNGESCLAEPKMWNVDPVNGDLSSSVSVDVKKTCQNYSIVAEIRGENGDVFDERVFLYVK